MSYIKSADLEAEPLSATEQENIYGLTLLVFIGGVCGMFAVFSVQPDPAKRGNDSAMVLCCAANLVCRSAAGSGGGLEQRVSRHSCQ